MSVLVLDGHERPALAIARSLGRRGLRVIVAAEDQESLAGASRFCAARVVCPSPQRDPAAFERFFLTAMGSERADVMMPVTDVTTRMVTLHQDALRRRTALAVPPASAFDTVTDKARLVEHAAACSVPLPRTVVVRGRDQLAGVIGRLTWPVVVKPFRSRVQTANRWLGTTVHYAGTPDELERLYDEVDYLQSCPSLIQERIVGPGEGLFVLFDTGRLVAAFAHRRLREKPPSGGVSVLRESVPVDARLKRHAERLLAPLGWHGPAMVEFKRDARSGQAYLMEVNGRFWGSLQLAVDAGVDFPFLTYQVALGQPVEAPPPYRVGVKSRWLIGDLDHLLLRLCRTNRSLSLPDGAPSRVRTLLDFLTFTGRDLHYEVLGIDDPRPFVHEATRYLRSLCSSAVRRLGRRESRLAPRADRAATFDGKRYRHAGPVQ